MATRKFIKEVMQCHFPTMKGYLELHSRWISTKQQPAGTCPQCESSSYYCIHAIFVDPNYPDKYYLFLRYCENCGHSQEAIDCEINITKEDSLFGVSPECPFCNQ